MSALRAIGISVHYGGLQALTDVDLEVASGRLVGLIGPNGAGKTTLIDAITGFTPMRGRVELDRKEISSLSPDHRARAGLARTWQSGELFDELSVAENLEVTAGRPSLRRIARELLLGRSGANGVVRRALALLGLEELADAKPDELTQGQRKLVGVARALAAKPHVICLDEPAAGLDTAESEALGRHLRQVVGDGTALLLVDHDMGLVLSVCDHVVVLDFGKVIARGTPDRVRRDPAVIRAYLGSAAGEVMEAAR
jgi:branched-chain amino acid transport system ATP-binding protein